MRDTCLRGHRRLSDAEATQYLLSGAGAGLGEARTTGHPITCYQESGDEVVRINYRWLLSVIFTLIFTLCRLCGARCAGAGTGPGGVCRVADRPGDTGRRVGCQ